MNQTRLPLGIQRVKVVALAVTDIDRANRFYKEEPFKGSFPRWFMPEELA